MTAKAEPSDRADRAGSAAVLTLPLGVGSHESDVTLAELASCSLIYIEA